MTSFSDTFLPSFDVITTFDPFCTVKNNKIISINFYDCKFRYRQLTYNYKWEERGLRFFSAVCGDPTLLILAGNKDMHKLFDDFKFQPDPSTDYVSL